MMCEDWQRIPFAEAVQISPHVELERGTMYPFVSMQAVTPGRRDVEANGLRVFKGGGSRFEDSDTLMARITPCLENGKIARFAVRDAQRMAHGSTEFIVIRGRSGVTDSRFVYYLTTSAEVRAFAISQMSGTSGRQRVPSDSLHHLLVDIPPLPEQRRIAHILGTLDDKIELNHRMNRTLEAIARTIFKSWFIDFAPVIDNAVLNGKPIPDEFAERAAVRRKILARNNKGVAACRHLFPDEFQDSPLGMIPKGWEVGHLNEHIRFALGGDWGKEAPDDVYTEPAYCIRGTDLPSLQDGQLPELRLRFLKSSSLKKRSLRPCDVVFEVSGGSPTQSTGRSLLINEALLGSYDRPLVCTNFCRLVQFSANEMSLFVGFLLNHLYSTGEFFAHETGTTTIKNFAFKRFIESFDVAISDKSVLTAFVQMLAPLLARRAQNGAESDVLSDQRDALLPELLSGRLA